MTESQLGAFLRTRRSATTPESVGLPPGSQRRVPGLRREEVAALAGVNVDYYARLEQGRESHPSTQVLNSLARVLAMDDEAREHLHRLAGTDPLLTVSAGVQSVNPVLRQLIAQWPDNPALVLNDALDILAINEIGRALHSSFARIDNLAEMVFTDPAGRRFYVHWDDVARDTVANLRMGWGRSGQQGRPQAIAETLRDTSAEFADLWAAHEVRGKSRARKELLHDEVGRFWLDYQTFEVGGAGQLVVVYVAEPGSAGEEALALLRTPRAVPIEPDR